MIRINSLDLNTHMMNLKTMIFLLVLTPCIAQGYKPLLDDYNEWHFTYCFFGCSTDRYFTNGDTLVDGLDYKILDGYHFISRTFLLREEPSDRKVYLNFVESTGNTEYLLYNFSLNVGDSIDMRNPITPFPDEAGYYRLDSIIPRPLVDGLDYRHFYLSPTESNTISTTNAIWIEGVGSLSLINAPSGYPDINDVGHLSCFFKNSIPFYSNLDSIDGCEPVIILNNRDFSESLEKVEIPSLIRNDYGQINNAESIRFVDIFDLNGRRIANLENNGQNEIDLNFSAYKSGIYLVVIYDKHFKKRTFKVLVD